MPRQRLKERIEELGLRYADVAGHLNLESERSVERYVQGKSTPYRGRRRLLAELLDWSPADLTLALNENGQGVRAPKGQTVPASLTVYASFEQGAARIWSYHPVSVPALLQTADYACAVEGRGPVPISAESVAHRVEMRLARQGVLSRDPDPLHLSIVLDESVLRRMAGGPKVMAAQLDHLAGMAEFPNVVLRVLPLDPGVHSAAFGVFIVLESQGAEGPQMVFVENRVGIQLMEGPYVVDAHMEVFTHLCSYALTKEESIDLISNTAEELRSSTR
jgi:transcriptional regulator with XRE-family HTH domain